LTYTPATSRTRRPIALLAILLPMIFICGASGSVTAIGDQLELHATHQAGVPLHQEPRGTHDFQRIPDGPTEGNVRHDPADSRALLWMALWDIPDCRAHFPQ